MTTDPDSQVVQKILENVRAGRDITIGDIQQIYQIVINLGNIPKPTGFPQNIPPSSTDKFVGRAVELERLRQQLESHNEVVIAAVEGMGGVGKTELAIQYSLLQLQSLKYPGGICWLQTREQDIGLQILNFARTDLGLQPPDDLELQQRVRWCWKHWHQGNTLVVLDDVKNYGHIEPYLPPQPSQFKVLITTRLKLGSLFLEVLPEEDALKLLDQLIGSEKITQELEKAKELIQRLGYLPLALQLVGRYVKERQISLVDMLQRLDKKGLGHPSLVVKENNPTWTVNIKRGVEAAFELSWEDLSITAQELGCLLSLFANAPIPWSLVESAASELDPESLEDARVELENLHLLQGKNTYQLYQLIREFLKLKLAASEQADDLKLQFCKAITKLAQQIPKSPTIKIISGVTVAIPHLIESATSLVASLSEEDFHKPFVGLGRFYVSQGFYDEAENWYQKCLSISQERFGGEHLEVAASLNNLALLYRYKGKYREAEKYFCLALNLSEYLLGNEHIDVSITLNNLGLVYCDQGQFDKAEGYFQKALQIQEQCLKEKSITERATTLNNLAYYYISLNNYPIAESLLKKALKIRQEYFGKTHPAIAESLNNLAYLYQETGQLKEAEHNFNEALKLRINLFGEEHLDVALSLYNLGILYANQKRLAEAKLIVGKSLAKIEETLGPKHRHTVSAHASYKNICDCIKLNRLES